MLGRARALRLVRAGQRYVVARGRLLAGGIAYSALFSIFAALAITWTVFVSVLGGNAELRATVLQAIDRTLPGILGDGSGSGLIEPDDLLLDVGLDVTSVVAGAVLLWSALSLMTAIRRAIQSAFGIVASPLSFFAAKGLDAVGFVGVVLGLLVGAALGLAAGTFGEPFLEMLGLRGSVAGGVLRVLGFLVAAVVDGAVFVLLVRVTAGVRPLRRDLLAGAGVAALLSGLLRVLGTGVLGVASNPLLASVAVVATLLLWVNLWGRAIIFAAAFAANPPAYTRPGSAEEVHFDDRPNYVTLSDPGTLVWRHQPYTGAIIPDPELRPGAGEGGRALRP